MTWKAKPSLSAYTSKSANKASDTSLQERPPKATAARIKAPVLRPCMCCNCARLKSLPTLAKSMPWPPAMPSLPEARANTCTRCNCCAAGKFTGRLNTSNAKVCKASPTNKAVAWSYCTWQVGLPRRRLSLSISGMSSCTKEYTCTYSMAAMAWLKASASAAPKRAAAATNKGRKRLPPPTLT